VRKFAVIIGPVTRNTVNGRETEETSYENMLQVKLVDLDPICVSLFCIIKNTCRFEFHVK
jgi:hypothetical protein